MSWLFPPYTVVDGHCNASIYFQENVTLSSDLECRNNEAPPVVQIAFKYTIMVRADEENKYLNGKKDTSSAGKGYGMKL